MRNSTQDCRSPAGITTGLVDGIISICRVLAKRDLTEATEALADLGADEDFITVVTAIHQADHAIPFAVERVIRDRIADELEYRAEQGKPLRSHHAVGVFDGFHAAAVVARGGEATG